jgi:alkylhydroperoxidase family enzyme
MSDEKLAQLQDFRASAQFTDAEKAALAYAEEMCRMPVDVPERVFAALREHFSDAQIVEITGMIALENLRARFNRSLLIESDGLCALPADHPVRRVAASTDG